MGGSTKHPTYKEVCSQKTGHFETVEIEYDPEIVSYESLVKFFFETHDFTQKLMGQVLTAGTQTSFGNLLCRSKTKRNR